jgi:hypothetical protein
MLEKKLDYITADIKLMSITLDECRKQSQDERALWSKLLETVREIGEDMKAIKNQYQRSDSPGSIDYGLGGKF